MSIPSAVVQLSRSLPADPERPRSSPTAPDLPNGGAPRRPRRQRSMRPPERSAQLLRLRAALRTARHPPLAEHSRNWRFVKTSFGGIEISSKLRHPPSRHPSCRRRAGGGRAHPDTPLRTDLRRRKTSATTPLVPSRVGRTRARAGPSPGAAGRAAGIPCPPPRFGGIFPGARNARYDCPSYRVRRSPGLSIPQETGVDVAAPRSPDRSLPGPVAARHADRQRSERRPPMMTTTTTTARRRIADRARSRRPGRRRSCRASAPRERST